MSLLQRLVLLCVLIEAPLATWLITERLYRPLPPLPDLTGYNPYTAQQLVDLLRQVDPDNAVDWADLGDAYLAHGFFPESESCFRIAVELAPGDAELRYRWALSLSSMGRMENAKQQLAEALATGFERPADCWYLIGRLELRQERPDEARKAFEQARPLIAARYELAKLDARSGNPTAAIDELSQVSLELPNAFRPHWLRAHAELALGHAAAAANHFDLAEVCTSQLPTPTHAFRKHVLAKFEAHSITALVNRGLELVNARQFAQADELLETAMGSYWDADVEDLRASITQHRGDLKQHVQQLQAIVERDGADSYRMWRSGLALAASDRLEEAVKAHREAVSLNTDPQSIDSLEQIADAYQRLGDSAQSQRYAARFRCAVGRRLFQETRLVESRATLAQSVQLNDDHAPAWFYLGEAERFLGNSGAAMDAYRRCLGLDPGHGRAIAARDRLTANER